MKKKMVDGASKRITNGPNIICWNAGVAQDLTADGIVAIGPLWSTMAYYGPLWSTMVYHDPLWSIMVLNGSLWFSMVHYGPPYMKLYD